MNTVAEPVAVAKNPSQTICVDGTPTDFEITLTGGLGTPTYQWYSNTTNNNTGGTLITETISDCILAQPPWKEIST